MFKAKSSYFGMFWSISQTTTIWINTSSLKYQKPYCYAEICFVPKGVCISRIDFQILSRVIGSRQILNPSFYVPIFWCQFSSFSVERSSNFNLLLSLQACLARCTLCGINTHGYLATQSVMSRLCSQKEYLMLQWPLWLPAVWKGWFSIKQSNIYKLGMVKSLNPIQASEN